MDDGSKDGDRDRGSHGSEDIISEGDVIDREGERREGGGVVECEKTFGLVRMSRVSSSMA
jgi:hypothetical protein